MTSQSSITNDRAQYASDTLQRIDRTIGELQAILSRDASGINRVLHWLCEQKEAARQAGFEAVSWLCEGVQESLAEPRCGKRPSSFSTELAALDACRTIRQLAGAIAECTARGRSKRVQCGKGETIANSPAAADRVAVNSGARPPPADQESRSRTQNFSE